MPLDSATWMKEPSSLTVRARTALAVVANGVAVLPSTFQSEVPSPTTIVEAMAATATGVSGSDTVQVVASDVRSMRSTALGFCVATTTAP
jgi:hypothetical protein